MEREIRIEAFAKINIGLAIGNPRPDGYHPILGIFHSVGISDKIRFRAEEGRGILVEGAFDCPAEATTVYKAAELFFRRTGIREGLAASVEKGIPVMAGLGGGSADAAATLLALDILFATKLGGGELSSLAGEIGADAPFFLRGGAAVVSGIGEVIEPIPPRGDFGILLIRPGFGVSTKWAYSELDSLRGSKGDPGRNEEERLDSPEAKRKLVAAFESAPARWPFSNAFGEMLGSAYPIYRELDSRLRDAGAAYASITGSGSCMYGIFGSVDEAREAERKLRTSMTDGEGKTALCGMALHSIKPLETSLLLG